MFKRSPALVLELCKAGVIKAAEKGVATDTAIIAAEPNLRSFVVGEWASLIQAAGAEAVAGIAPRGAPYAALLAERIGGPFAVVDCSAQPCVIYGKVRGRRVALVSDTSEDEEQIINGLRGLSSAGARVVIVSVIIDTDSKLKKSLKTHYAPLVRASDIVAVCSSAFGG